MLTLNSFATQADGLVNSFGGEGTIHINPGGSVTKSAGSGTYSMPNMFLSIQSGGTVTANSGTLALPLGSYAGGVSFNAAASGAIIDLQPANINSTFADTFTGPNNGGTVRLSGGTFGGGPYGSAGTFLNFPGNVFQWTGGTINNGYTGVTNLGTMAIAGNVTDSNDGFTNSGVINHRSGTFTLYNGNNDHVGFVNAVAGIYNLTGAVTVTGPIAEFYNYGLVTKSGNNTASFTNLDFDNFGGTIQVNRGTLQLSGSGAGSGGTDNVANGGILDLIASGGNVTFSGTYSGSGNGTVRLSTGTLTANNPDPTTFNFSGNTFQWTGGIINPNNGGVNDPNKGFFNIGTMTIAGDVTDASWSFWNRGTINHVSGSLSLPGGGFNNDVAGTYNILGQVSKNGSEFYNDGTLAFGPTGGKFDINGSLILTGTGTLSFAIGGTTAVTDYGVLNQPSTGLTLGGELAVSLANGFVPQSTDTFTIVTTSVPLAGAFSNVASGARLNTSDGRGSFVVTYSSPNDDATAADNVVLSGFQPSVTVTASPKRINEGSSATYTISLPSGNTTQNTKVRFVMSGTATLGIDYTLGGAQLNGNRGQVTIPAGQASATVTLQALTDTVQEGTETAVMTMSKGSGYTLGTPRRATVQIVNVP